MDRERIMILKKDDFETFQLFISFLEKNENKMIKQVGQLEIKLKIRKQSNRNILNKVEKRFEKQFVKRTENYLDRFQEKEKNKSKKI